MICESVSGRRLPDVRDREDETGLWKEPPGTWRWRLYENGLRELEAVLPSRYPEGPGIVHPHQICHCQVAGPESNRPRWAWDGDEQNPTLSPSILVETHWGPDMVRVFWHGYLVSGSFTACE